MSNHDRFAAHELIHRWWFNYGEGNMEVLEGLLTEDAHLLAHRDRAAPVRRVHPR